MKKLKRLASSAIFVAAAGAIALPTGTFAATTDPGYHSPAVGFIFVGSEHDYGYNEAAYVGSLAVQKAFPHLKILRAENVPETAEVQRVEEDMIRQGAKIIFATSYGYLDPTLIEAKKFPNVLLLHQGGLKTAPNLSTYFGNIWQTEYLAGIAAGKLTKTNKLGFVSAFPIPQALLNINAFELGAQSVNPKATTHVVFTGSWADPSSQASAANTLISQGVDVLTQHQDATATVIQAAERAHIWSVGYHFDAASLAPNGWITGSVWNWSSLYVKLVRAAENGTFSTSPYHGMYFKGLKEGVIGLAPFGKNVPMAVRRLVQSQEKLLTEGKLDPFKGPIYSQTGKLEIPKGVDPSVTVLNSDDYLVKGVVGSIK